jgi:uncharacterized membrane protein
MTKPTFTDILFCFTFSILGLVAFSMGIDTALYSNYHGAGLMLAVAGLLMIAVSGNESLKL